MYDLDWLTALIKYSLFSLALAALIFGGLLVVIYLQGTAVEIADPEWEISPRGVMVEASSLRDDFEEGRQENFTGLQESQELLSGVFSGESLSDKKKSMINTRRDFFLKESQARLQQLSHKYEHELEIYREKELSEARAAAEQKEREIEEKMQELAVEIDERELEMLQEYRQEIGQHYREELMNLRLKKRVLDLSGPRKAEIDLRIEELEEEIDVRMAEVRDQFEARIRQEMMRRSARLQHELDVFVRRRMALAQSNISRRKESIEEVISSFEDSEEERLEEYLGDYSRRVKDELSELEERYRHFSD